MKQMNTIGNTPNHILCNVAMQVGMTLHQKSYIYLFQYKCLRLEIKNLTFQNLVYR